MVSVTNRIKTVKQPRGGYIHPKLLEVIDLQQENDLFEQENINAGVVGTVVDYLTRFMSGTPLYTAFKISLIGALNINKGQNAEQLLKKIKGLDDTSIYSACQLAGYDVCCRSATGFVPVDTIMADKKTIFNIREMVKRSLCFFEEYGPITLDGFTFEEGYGEYITTGDADFLTESALWDFKVTKNAPTNKHTLQLLIYYIMGLHSIHQDYFYSLEYLAIFNPRLNRIYRIRIDSISDDIIEEVSRDVIGISV